MGKNFWKGFGDPTGRINSPISIVTDANLKKKPPEKKPEKKSKKK